MIPTGSALPIRPEPKQMPCPRGLLRSDLLQRTSESQLSRQGLRIERRANLDVVVEVDVHVALAGAWRGLAHDAQRVSGFAAALPGTNALGPAFQRSSGIA